jgi:hypothetical protein
MFDMLSWIALLSEVLTSGAIEAKTLQTFAGTESIRK